MSFQRREFLTAAGSTLLASIAGVLEAQTPPARGAMRKKPAKVDDAIEDLTQGFLAGYPKTRSQVDEELIRDTLYPIYHRRYRKRHDAMLDEKYDMLWRFAFVLGTITDQCLQHEIAGECGWVENKKAALRPDHIDRAREILGFALNSVIIKETNGGGCYKVPPEDPKNRQIDKQCPLCQMAP